MELLLSCDAHVNFRDECGMTALLYAVQNRRRADVNVRSDGGRSALLSATERDFLRDNRLRVVRDRLGYQFRQSRKHGQSVYLLKFTISAVMCHDRGILYP